MNTEHRNRHELNAIAALNQSHDIYLLQACHTFIGIELVKDHLIQMKGAHPPGRAGLDAVHLSKLTQSELAPIWGGEPPREFRVPQGRRARMVGGEL